MPLVVLAMPRILQYRVALLDLLREQLRENGIGLRVVHGEAPERVRLQRDDGHLAWGERLSTRSMPVAGGRTVWMPLAAAARDADMVIVPELAGWLATYDVLLRRAWRRQVVACWGHGPAPDDHAANRLSRAVRRTLARRFDWWFSYTDGTTQRLTSAGVAPDRVTTLYNTIDVEGLRSDVVARQADREALRGELGVEGPTALFIGALRANKRIDRVLDVGEQVAERIGGFTLIVAGDGPLRGLVEHRLASAPWLRYAGPAFDADKAGLLAASDVMLQPTHLGLAVLDAFAAGLPLVTLDGGAHSPEHEYLHDGVEGVRVPVDDDRALAAAVIDVLTDDVRRKSLASAAWQAGSRFTLKSMVDRFAAGVDRALGLR